MLENMAMNSCRLCHEFDNRSVISQSRTWQARLTCPFLSVFFFVVLSANTTWQWNENLVVFMVWGRNCSVRLTVKKMLEWRRRRRDREGRRINLIRFGFLLWWNYKVISPGNITISHMTQTISFITDPKQVDTLFNILPHIYVFQVGRDFLK